MSDDSANYMPVRVGYTPSPVAVRMDALSEEQAQKNHSQSLERLRERNGISPSEALALHKEVDWPDLDVEGEEEAIIRLLNTNR